MEEVLWPCHTHTFARNKDDIVYLINATKTVIIFCRVRLVSTIVVLGGFIARFKRDVRLTNPLIHRCLHFFHYKRAFRYHITFHNTHQMFRPLRPGFLRNSVDQLLLHESFDRCSWWLRSGTHKSRAPGRPFD